MTSFMDSPLVFSVERLHFSLSTPRVSCRLDDSCLRLGESAFSLSTPSVCCSLEDLCLRRGEAAFSLRTPRVSCSLEDPCFGLGEDAFSLSTPTVNSFILSTRKIKIFKVFFKVSYKLICLVEQLIDFLLFQHITSHVAG